MDYDEKKRHQLIRVAIAEIGMVLSVVLIVVISIMAAMGFFIADDGKIEQSGLMQIHSMPTGARVELDGTTLFSRTNLSRTMAAGEHELRISKTGYDTWENTLEMYSGILIRLYYPRLFLLNRNVETVMEIADKDLEFYAPSESRNYVLYAEKNAPDWHLLDMRGDEIKETTLDLSGILPGMVAEETPKSTQNLQKTPEFVFSGKVLDLKWSANDEKVLAQIEYEKKVYWILVNLRNVAASRNLTSEFGLDFEKIEMIDNAANQLFALENAHLRKISASEGAISRVLVDRVRDFEAYGTSILYVATGAEGEQEIATYRDGESGGTVIATAAAGARVKVVLSRYYDEDYMVYTIDDLAYIKYGVIPSYREEGANLGDLKMLVDGLALGMVPEKAQGRSSGGYAMFWSGKQVKVVNLNMGETYEYTLPSEKFGWIDENMLYGVIDGEIKVWDYDGANMRNLAETRAESTEVAKVKDESVMISANDRWLYYLSADGDKINLLREKIRD